MVRIKNKDYCKSSLISDLAKNKNIPTQLATLIVDTFFKSIKASLAKKKKVHIRGFGSFEIRNYKAYKGKNPQNNKTIHVKAKKVPFFKPGNIKQEL